MSEEGLATRFCEERGLNINLLAKILMCRALGSNNADCARELGIHRATVQRYVKVLQDTEESTVRSILRELYGSAKKQYEVKTHAKSHS